MRFPASEDCGLLVNQVLPPGVGPWQSDSENRQPQLSRPGGLPTERMPDLTQDC